MGRVGIDARFSCYTRGSTAEECGYGDHGGHVGIGCIGHSRDRGRSGRGDDGIGDL